MINCISINDDLKVWIDDRGSSLYCRINPTNPIVIDRFHYIYVNKEVVINSDGHFLPIHYEHRI